MNNNIINVETKYHEKMVSVVIPSYEAKSEKLEKSVRSVLSQTYKPLEIIVVDDGSWVPFSGIEEKVELRHQNIRWLKLPENVGVSGARNRGVEESSGAYISFLDAGDWWEANKLEKQIAIIEGAPKGNCFIYSSAIVHTPSRNIFLKAEKFDDLLRELLVWQPISGSASSILVSQEALRSTGGFATEGDIPEDRDMWIRLAQHYNASVDTTFSVHLDGEELGRSSDAKKKAMTYSKFLDKHKALMKERNVWGAAVANYYFTIAVKAFKNGALMYSGFFIFKGFCFRPIKSFLLVKRRLFHYFKD